MDAVEHICNFKRGLSWYTYQDLEARLLELSKYITFDCQNKNTWGEKIASLLILTGSAIDTFFRDMMGCPYLYGFESYSATCEIVGRRRWNIHNFRDAFDQIFEFSENQIMVPFGLSAYPEVGNPNIKPFKDFSIPNGVPQWWTTYNGLKHDYYDTLKKATLDCVINAVGGLLLLNSLHICSREYLARQYILTSELRKAFPDDEYVQHITQSPIGIPISMTPLYNSTIKTRIFLYEYRIDRSDRET